MDLRGIEPLMNADEIRLFAHSCDISCGISTFQPPSSSKKAALFLSIKRRFFLLQFQDFVSGDVKLFADFRKRWHTRCPFPILPTAYVFRVNLQAFCKFLLRHTCRLPCFLYALTQVRVLFLFSFVLKMKAMSSFASPTTTKNTPNFKSILFTRLWVYVIFLIGGGFNRPPVG